MTRLLAYRLTVRLVFGESGVDIRSRLILDEALEARFPNPQERRTEFLRILPLTFGDRFPRLALVFALAVGAAFVLAAPRTLVKMVLQPHTAYGWIAYGLVLLQWLLFYFATSILGAGIAGLAALISYGKRIGRT